MSARKRAIARQAREQALSEQARLYAEVASRIHANNLSLAASYAEVSKALSLANVRASRFTASRATVNKNGNVTPVVRDKGYKPANEQEHLHGVSQERGNSVAYMLAATVDDDTF